MQKTYELVVLLHPDLEIDVESPIKKVEGIITAAGGKVAKRDNWGKKRLAYRIKHQDFAIYVYFEVELPTEAVRSVESTLLITDEVLRHILVVHEEPPKSAKAAKPAREPETSEPETEEKEA
jgi:small subunit ribosomal protein S6